MHSEDETSIGLERLLSNKRGESDQVKEWSIRL